MSAVFRTGATKKIYVISSPEQRSRRAVVLPPASALALASATTVLR